jgi:tRNA(Arg) A34 adenosine deaminase TadA
VWAEDPARAHLRLRRRIVSRGPDDAVARARVVVAAKAWTAGVVPGGHGDVGALVDVTGAAATAWETAVAAVTFDPGGAPWEAAWRAAGEGRRSDRVATSDRPVGAVLVVGGRPVAAARAASGVNRLLHAEQCLLAGWHAAGHRGLPAGAEVFVTLQCCRMCAAALVGAARGALSVRFAVPDPGRLARDTALAARGWERHDAGGQAGEDAVVEALRERL